MNKILGKKTASYFVRCGIIGSCLASFALAQSNSDQGNGHSAAAPGQSTGQNDGSAAGTAPGQSGNAPGQTGSTPGQSGKAPGLLKSEGDEVIGQLNNHGKSLDLNFAKTDPKGMTISGQKGVPTVMYFWSARDQASVDALPLIRVQAAKYSSAVFIGINVDSPASAIKGSPDGKPLPGTQSWEPRGLNSDVARRLGVPQVPMVYVFDTRGVLRSAGPPRELPVLLDAALH